MLVAVRISRDFFLLQVVGRIHDDIAKLADDNLYHLDYIVTAAAAAKRKREHEEAVEAAAGDTNK